MNRGISSRRFLQFCTCKNSPMGDERDIYNGQDFSRKNLLFRRYLSNGFSNRIIFYLIFKPDLLLNSLSRESVLQLFPALM